MKAKDETEKTTTALPLWRTNGKKDFRVSYASVVQWNSQETQKSDLLSCKHGSSLMVRYVDTLYIYA